MKACECGYELDDQQFENEADGSKRARCPKCLSFVVMSAEEVKQGAEPEHEPDE